MSKVHLVQLADGWPRQALRLSPPDQVIWQCPASAAFPPARGGEELRDDGDGAPSPYMSGAVGASLRPRPSLKRSRKTATYCNILPTTAREGLCRFASANGRLAAARRKRRGLSITPMRRA